MKGTKTDFHFSISSIMGFVWRGILVGIVSGSIVSLFRLMIEHLFEFVLECYKNAHQRPIYLILIALLGVLSSVFVGYLIKSDSNIKGSGIPHVEGELKGILHPSWWSVLWKKFLGGILSISMGQMLGREGPSIQLGAMGAKGVARYLKASRMERRVLIASGAAAGLSAAFNAPIAGLLFVVEEIYHHFSRLIWITALVASLVANFISLNIFGLSPVLALSQNLPTLALNYYWILLVLGVFLGIMGFLYEKTILNFNLIYEKCFEWFPFSSSFYGVIPAILIIPVGYFLPQLLGGGNRLITSLPNAYYGILTIFIFFIIRYLGSMISYSSGLPGGIFLPILTLGSLAGVFFARVMVGLGLLSQDLLPLFIVLGMSGYFGAISKAPLTAMILVTEMVGDLRQLMVIAVVTLVAYIVMDVLKGEPIYEAMLEKMKHSRKDDIDQPTLIELVVSDKIAGKVVKDLKLPKNVLITTQVINQKSQVVYGNTRLKAGATIFVVVTESQVSIIRRLLMSS